ncbi:MAG: hypothetical protein NTV94_03675, partial [Planctomycetota bacterium]|nr:hypothetical protein [Planctomycetota bacterium]
AMIRFVWTAILLLVAAFASPRAWGSEPSGCMTAFSIGAPAIKAVAGGAAATGKAPLPTHAWLLTPDSRGRGGMIWHLPPRGSALNLGSPHGMVRLAADVPRLPVGMAAVGERLFMIFEEPPSEIPSSKPREVVSLFAAATGDVPGTLSWVTRPIGRFDVAPPLRNDGRVLATSGTPDGVAVLMHGLSDFHADPMRVSLLMLGKQQWFEATLPADLIAYSRLQTTRGPKGFSIGGTWSLVPTSQGVAIIAELEPGKFRLWAASFNRDLIAEAQAAAINAPASLPEQWASWASCSGTIEMVQGARVAQWVSDGQQLVAIVVGPDGAASVERTLFAGLMTAATVKWTSVANLGSHASGAVLPGKFAAATFLGASLGSLVRPDLAIIGEGEGLAGEAGMAMGGGRMIAEVSLGTGRVLAVVPVAPQNPVSAADYRLMGAMFLLITATILIFLARPPGTDPGQISLPKLTALADPMPRIIAGGIDLLAASVLGTGLWKIPVRSLATA